ncbi:MAG: hypothetical protein ACRD0D_04835, partial [Acidimicrobiales bacterium]
MVVTADGVECWRARRTSGFGWTWLHWDPIECPDTEENEVREVSARYRVDAIGGWMAHLGSRVERFDNGAVSTGADLTSHLNGQPAVVDPGWLVNWSELWVL